MTLFNSYYDIIFLCIIAFSAVLAFIRGGVSEILSLSTWFISFWLVGKIGNHVNHIIPNNITNLTIRNIIIFIVIFIVVAIFIALIKKILSGVIKAIGLSGLDYLAGIAFGIIRGILICAVLIVILQFFNFDTKHSYEKAHLYPIIAPITAWINKFMPTHTSLTTKDALNAYNTYSESQIASESIATTKPLNPSTIKK